MVDATEEDDAFLFELYCSTRAEEVAAWNWPPAEREAFLQMQYRCQKDSYALQYPQAVNQIVQSGGQRVGRLLTARLPDAIAVVDVALLPSCRSKGLGTRLLQAVQNVARAEGRCIRLHVLMYSQARRLYDRLGFREDGWSLPYVRLLWSPTEPAGAATLHPTMAPPREKAAGANQASHNGAAS